VTPFFWSRWVQPSATFPADLPALCCNTVCQTFTLFQKRKKPLPIILMREPDFGRCAIENSRSRVSSAGGQSSRCRGPTTTEPQCVALDFSSDGRHVERLAMRRTHLGRSHGEDRHALNARLAGDLRSYLTPSRATIAARVSLVSCNPVSPTPELVPAPLAQI